MLYDKNGVQVDTTRFIVHGTTYPINTISSVQALQTKDRDWKLAIGAVIGGLLVGGMVESSVGGTIGSILGFAVIIGGFVGAYYLRPKNLYYVSIATASGEQQAYASYDMQEIQDIVNSINQAIVNRG
jgi:hypothetical protein